MSQDLLERATKALREQGGAEPPVDRAAFMRARVLSQAKRGSKLRPQTVWQWAAVVCLGFFVSTAMAQVIRVQLPRMIEALRREPAAEEQKTKKPKAKPLQPKAAAPRDVEATKLAEEPAPGSVEAPAAPAGVGLGVPGDGAEPAASSVGGESAAPSGGQARVAVGGGVGPAAPSSGAESAALSGGAGSAAPSGGSGSAAGSGVRQPRPASGAVTTSATSGSSRSTRATKRALTSRSLSANIPAQPNIAPPPAAEPDEVPAPEAASPAEPAVTPSSKPKAPAPEPAELALFRRAQSLHLAHDPRAIAAWDAFLRAAPSSALAPEARYNRALGLVRAHNSADARRALQPFAAGAYGSYRKQEAQQLLDRLPK